MTKKIIVPNLIIKILATLFTVGLMVINYMGDNLLRPVEPSDIYITITFVVMLTSTWTPLLKDMPKKKGGEKSWKINYNIGKNYI